jgi:tRNA threonylcarbamoyl adenosine modification protein YeaZ
MIHLSVETSTEVMGLALLDDDRVLAELSLLPPVGASESLVSALDWILGSRGLGLDAIELISCSSGPGSYTSLRAGFAFVRGLEAALGIPLVAVRPFDTLARQWSMLEDRALLAVLNARQGQISAALFDKDPSNGFFRVPSGPVPPVLSGQSPSDPAEIVACLPKAVRIVGPGSPILLAFLSGAEGAMVDEAYLSAPRASCQGLVAWDRWLEPRVPPRLVYGRSPV